MRERITIFQIKIKGFLDVQNSCFRYEGLIQKQTICFNRNFQSKLTHVPFNRDLTIFMIRNNIETKQKGKAEKRDTAFTASVIDFFIILDKFLSQKAENFTFPS